MLGFFRTNIIQTSTFSHIFVFRISHFAIRISHFAFLISISFAFFFSIFRKMNNTESIILCQALLQLGYVSFESLNSALNKENRRASNSLWGILCISMYGVNRERKRTLLYTNWMKNRGQIKDLVAAEMSSKGD